MVQARFRKLAFATVTLSISIFLLAGLIHLTATPTGAQPPVLESGMNPENSLWIYSSPRDPSADKRVKFWLKVQRQGYLNRYGNFGYSLTTKVFRPDGSVAWSTVYGFDQNGYSEIDFSLPALFYERRGDRPASALGLWRIRLSVTENESRREVAGREFNLLFVKVPPGTTPGGTVPPPTGVIPPVPGGPVTPPTPPPASPPSVVFLSDLAESRTGDIHGGLGKDRPYWQNDLIIAGKKFRKGIVTHPVAENGRKAFVEYSLNGAYRMFRATLGSAEDHGNYGQGTMNYCVIVDGRQAECDRFPAPSTTRDISINVTGAGVLRLEVDNGYNGNNSDHAAWGDARLER